MDAYPQRPFEKGEYPLVYAYKGETTVVADPLFNDPEENDFSFHPKSPVKKIQKTTKVKMKKKKTFNPATR